MRDVAILGVGLHKFGRFGDKPYVKIGLEASMDALKDANIKWADIEGAYVSRVFLPATSGVRILSQLGRTGISIFDLEAACASGGIALREAYRAVAYGAVDTALVLGVEKMPRGFIDPGQIYDSWQIHMGLSVNPSYWSLRAKRHMYEYGTTDLQIAKVAYKNHKNSVDNPYAMYQKEFTLDEIMNSPLVIDPIHLYEICAPNEGAAAVVLCAADDAGKYTSKPIVTIESCVHTVALYSSDFRAPTYFLSAQIENPPPTEVTCKKAYEAAGLGPENIDIIECQDTDAFCELEAYEQLGLCQTGESGQLIDEGVTDKTGKIPVNVSGGLICKGEPVGASHLGQVVELAWQLRGEAGRRQVNDPKIALAHVLGAGGNCCVTILKRS